MSYLELPAGVSDFSKAVISLWFRVPQASIDAGAADAPGDSGFDMPLKGIVPLLTFGPNSPITNVHLGSSFTGPSHVGLKCYPGEAPTLMVKLQTSTVPPETPGLAVEFPVSGDYFVIGDYPYYSAVLSGEVGHYIEPAADTWHHLLISFDIGLPLVTPGSESGFDPNLFTSAPKFWWAFDDVNYNGEDLFPYGLGARVNTATGAAYDNDPNYITSAYTIGAGMPVGSGTPEGGVILQPYDFAFPAMPTESEELGTPSSTAFVGKVYPVELAELQFFIGVTLDTSITENRRAFVDADGLPVPPVPPMIDNPAYNPDLPTSSTNPVKIPDPDGSPAQKLLGQPPAILLHGSSNWIAGKNTGPMIDNPDYDPDLPTSPTNPLKIPDPDFQFTPAGQIVAYTPDPSLAPVAPLRRRTSIHA